MRKRSRYLALLATPLLVTGVLLAGCTAVAATDPDAVATVSETSGDVGGDATAAEIMAANDAYDDDSDKTWDEADVVAISLDGDTAASDSDAVSIDGATVTITAAGTYELTGSLTDGQVVVASTGEGIVRLVLNGVEIANSTGSALQIDAADDAVVVLADGSSNSLSDAASYADTADANAALYSAVDLTIMGSGSLEVTGNGNDGISSQDGLVITDGAITVDAVDDGVRGKDSLVITGGELTVTAGGDGLKSDNDEDGTRGYLYLAGGSTEVTSAGDGLSASTDVVVADGTLDVVSGGGHETAAAADASTKGVKGDVSVVIAGGELTVDASDDALHSNGAVIVTDGAVSLASGDDGMRADAALTLAGGTVIVTSSYEGLEAAAIIVSGGSTTVTSTDDGLNAAGGTSADTASAGAAQAPMGGGDAVGDFSVSVSGGSLVLDSGGDGLDSNGTATITGGTVVVNGPTDNGNGALDVNGEFTVTGGTLLAAGSSGMAVAPSTSSAQASVMATFDGTQQAGTVVQIADSAGVVVASLESTKDFSSVVFSSAAIIAGQTYTVYTGGSVTGTTVGGFSATGDLTGAEQSTTATAGEYTSGGAMGGGGMRPPQRP